VCIPTKHRTNCTLTIGSFSFPWWGGLERLLTFKGTEATDRFSSRWRDHNQHNIVICLAGHKDKTFGGKGTHQDDTWPPWDLCALDGSNGVPFVHIYPSIDVLVRVLSRLTRLSIATKLQYISFLFHRSHFFSPSYILFDPGLLMAFFSGRYSHYTSTMDASFLQIATAATKTNKHYWGSFLDVGEISSS
jgi:hypothetical protein